MFRIMDIWETREAAEKFSSERLMPIVEELLSGRPDAPPPAREGYYELHDLIRG